MKAAIRIPLIRGSCTSHIIDRVAKYNELFSGNSFKISTSKTKKEAENKNKKGLLERDCEDGRWVKLSQNFIFVALNSK